MSGQKEKIKVIDGSIEREQVNNITVPDEYDYLLVEKSDLIHSDGDKVSETHALLKIEKTVVSDALEVQDGYILISKIKVEPMHSLNLPEEAMLESKYFTEHPFKGLVVAVGKQKENCLKLAPGDTVYYNASYRHYEFRFDNETYILLDSSSVIAKIK